MDVENDNSLSVTDTPSIWQCQDELTAVKVDSFFTTKIPLTWNTYDISSIKRVTRRFHIVVVQNNGKEMYKKSVLHVQSCFLLIRPVILSVYFFTVLVAVLPFRIT